MLTIRATGVVVAAVALSAGLVVSAAPGHSHETATVGPLEVTVGWAREPAYTGIENLVEVSITEVGRGPVADVGTGLTAAVSFGPASVVLALVPGDRPGVVQAALLPTRPGSYTIHVTGSVRDQAVDLTSTCSDTSFDCVTDQAEIQFPAKDPPTGQIAERLERELRRGQRAQADATSARRLAVAGLLVGGAGLAVAAVSLGLLRRARRQPHTD